LQRVPAHGVGAQSQGEGRVMGDTPDATRFCVTCGQPVLSEAVAAEMLQLLKATVRPFAALSDDALRKFSDAPEPRTILAIRAVIARAEGG
jgi:hypothetical protein